VIKFLTLLMALIERFFSAQETAKLRQEGRQETIKEMNDAINRQVELGEAAVAIPDPERDERLRSRFDRSRDPK
jgi:hypothetical protein